jgi:hypothetical protein
LPGISAAERSLGGFNPDARDMRLPEKFFEKQEAFLKVTKQRNAVIFLAAPPLTIDSEGES